MVRKSKQSGFSMLELMIVMAVMGIMATFAIPGFIKWNADFRLKGAARDLLSNFQKAKLYAIKNRANCAITFTEDGSGTVTGYSVYVDSNEDYTYTAGENIVAEVVWAENYKSDVKLASVTFADNANNESTVAFKPSGIPAQNGGAPVDDLKAELKNKDDSKTLQVIISTAGNVRINKP